MTVDYLLSKMTDGTDVNRRISISFMNTIRANEDLFIIRSYLLGYFRLTDINSVPKIREVIFRN